MKKAARSYILSILLMTLMSAAVCGQAIPLSEHNIEPLGIGDSLPEFLLTDTDYNSISLYDYLEMEPLVLIYYRGGW